jgi:hypothetical protein
MAFHQIDCVEMPIAIGLYSVLVAQSHSRTTLIRQQSVEVITSNYQMLIYLAEKSPGSRLAEYRREDRTLCARRGNYQIKI